MSWPTKSYLNKIERIENSISMKLSKIGQYRL